MAMQRIAPVDAHDSGIVLEATLVFVDFDPTGATFAFEVDDDANFETRPMSWDGAVARYTFVAGEFRTGMHRGQVRVTKDPVSIRSARFAFEITS